MLKEKLLQFNSTDETQIYDLNSVILFANTKSGSNKAKKYLELKTELLCLKTNLGSVNLQIFSLQAESELSLGIEHIKSMVAAGEYIRVVVAGGDGSLIGVIEQVISHGVDISRVFFGIMPFGTGNDLAAMLGWGRSPPKQVIGKNLEGLRKSVEEWTSAEPLNLDIWQVEIEVHSDGYFEKISVANGGFFREKLKNKFGEELKEYSRLMTNYFSTGLDARIGLGFDKKRSKNKNKNKCVYFWEGVKKMFCLPVPRVTEYTASLYQSDKCIFNNANEEEKLPNNTTVLLALNARTYAGGDNFVWDKAKPRHSQEWLPQSPRDGTLEFLTFKGVFDLGLENLVPGRAHKLTQSPGPYYLEFGDTESRVYMQIDGEYFYAIKPKCAKVYLSEISKDLKVLTKACN